MHTAMIQLRLLYGLKRDVEKIEPKRVHEKIPKLMRFDLSANIFQGCVHLHTCMCICKCMCICICMHNARCHAHAMHTPCACHAHAMHMSGATCSLPTATALLTRT